MRHRLPSPTSAAPWFLAGALLLIAAAAVALLMRRAVASHTPAEPLRFSFLAMGTVGEIAVSGAPADLAAAAADAAEARIAALEADYSAFRPDSLVSRLNRGERVPLPDDGQALFRLAFRVAEASGGAFDPTVGPLLRAWGLRGGAAPVAPPDATALSNALARVGWHRVRLLTGSPKSEAQSPNSGDFGESSGKLFAQCDDGVELDFGGVAKGLAVDRAYDAALSALAEGGCPDAGLLVNLGGNIRARGRPRPGSDGWTVAIRDPFQPLGRGSVGTLLLTNGLATATSGSYERFIEIGGERFSHIIDPRTGRPVRGVAQATVLAPTAAEADALSTAFFVLGAAAPKALYDAFPAAEVRFVFESSETGH